MKCIRYLYSVFLIIFPFGFQASQRTLAAPVGQNQRMVNRVFLAHVFSTQYADEVSLTAVAKEQLGLTPSEKIDYSKLPKKADRDVLFNKLFNMCDARTMKSCSVIALSVLCSAPAHYLWNQSCAAGACEYRYLGMVLISVGLSLKAHYDNYINWTDKANLKALNELCEHQD